MLPLVKQTLYKDDPEFQHFSVLVFGKQSQLYVLDEDDGRWCPTLNEIRLIWDNARKQEGGFKLNPENKICFWTKFK